MADSKQVRADIVAQLLSDAALFDRFLQDPDSVLAGFPGLDKFNGRYLKNKVKDRGSLLEVATRFGVQLPEAPPAAPPAAAPEEPPRLQMARRLHNDPAFFALYQKESAAAFAAYPDLEEEHVTYLQENITDAASLEAIIQRLETIVRNTDSSPAKGIELAEDEPPPRYVNTGFTSHATPATINEAFNTPLPAAQPHYFWLQIGDLMKEGLAQTPIELPTDQLPPEAHLKIALFSFEDEIALIGADIGKIKLAPEGDIVVTQRADEPAGVPADILDQRLYFAVQTMVGDGYGRLRCNIYYENTLVQSHLIVARVMADPTLQPNRMLWHTSDYTLSQNLNSEQLTAMGHNILSIMVNDNGNGTHGFRFIGDKEYKNDATLGEGEVTKLLQLTRGALRKTAWGDEEPYKDGKKYKYAKKQSIQELQADLLALARSGHDAVVTLMGPLVGDSSKLWDVMDWMVKPGQVQIAAKENAQLIVPAAMFYDYPFLDGNPASDYSLCPTFVEALSGDKPLEACACFQGNCPSYGQELVVCPSGFWGFRHALGLPVSVKSAPDAPLHLGGSSPPKMAISVWKDFDKRATHEKSLQEMGVGWEYADSRDEALTMLKATDSQVVYFYCHGGLSKKDKPYLKLGDDSDDWFTPGNLFTRRIRWQKIRPLVFINGCHTTQLTPERALDFVSQFVETSWAAGVIGTEITIFEPIAVQFAEACLHRFLFNGQTLGEAVRSARLNMLKDGNPLGLVYIPYALPALKLTK